MLPKAVTHSPPYPPFLSFLSDLVQKRAKADTSTSKWWQGGVSTLDSGSEISLMNSDTLVKVARAMPDLGKPLQIETCNLSITSYTQDRSPITRRAWLDLTFQEMTLVHPIYICIIDTEALLIIQHLLDQLAPLIDCHRGHIWAQVNKSRLLGDGQPISNRQVTAMQESRGLCRCSCLFQSLIMARPLNRCMLVTKTPCKNMSHSFVS